MIEVQILNKITFKSKFERPRFNGIYQEYGLFNSFDLENLYFFVDN